MKSPEGPTATTSPHLEKKQNIIERLDKRVQVIASLLENYDELAHMDPEELIIFIKENKDKLRASFTPDVTTRMDYYYDLRDKLDKTEDRSVKEECYTKMHALAEDDEVNFAIHIEFFFERMQGVVKQNMDLRKDPLYWRKMLTYNSPSGGSFTFKPKDTSRIDEDNFSTGIFIKYKAWQRVMKDTKYMFADGFAVRDTDAVYVKETSYRDNETLRHERVHHLLDKIPRYEIYNHAAGIKNKMAQIRELIEKDYPEHVIEAKINTLLSDSTMRRYMNGMHNEFLAETSSLGSNSLKEIIGSEIPVGFNRENNRGLGQQINHLATAGEQIKQIFSALKSLPQELSNLGLEEAAQKAKISTELFRNLFNLAAQEVEHAVVYGNLLGSQASIEVDSLFFILQPTNYRHIKTYLSTKYEEDFLFIEKHRNYLIEGRSSIKEFLIFMENVKQEKLTDSSREIIFRSMFNLIKGPLNFGRLGEEAVLKLMEYASNMQTMLGDNGKNITIDIASWVLGQTLTMCITSFEFKTKILSSVPAGSFKGLGLFVLADLKESIKGGDEEKNKSKMDKLIELCREKGVQFIEDDLNPEEE